MSDLFWKVILDLDIYSYPDKTGSYLIYYYSENWLLGFTKL